MGGSFKNKRSRFSGKVGVGVRFVLHFGSILTHFGVVLETRSPLGAIFGRSDTGKKKSRKREGAQCKTTTYHGGCRPLGGTLLAPGAERNVWAQPSTLTQTKP